MNSSKRRRNSVVGLGVIQDKLEVSFAKAPARAGSPTVGRLMRGPRLRRPRVCGPRDGIHFSFLRELIMAFYFNF